MMHPGGAFWKEDWDLARQRLTQWWRHEGLALCITAPKDEPWADLPEPEPAATDEQRWLDPLWRVRSAEYRMSRTFYGGAAFPYLDSEIGPGSLGAFIGSEPGFAPDTVWYRPCIEDPDTHPELRFAPQNRWFQAHLALIDEGLKAADGRYLVGIPDLIENVDTLAQLRGPQTLMEDMLENPEFVERRVAEINRAYFQAFDALFERVRDPWGGNAFAAFCIWGPGKTAKVQCDASAMFSPAMFARFVSPALAKQCAWLDYSMYHLDGTQCFVHLDNLLAIDSLDAIEWTPQAGIENGGSPRWYDLYRRIKAGGKSVQAIGVEYDEVEPLIDAVGPEGLFIMTTAESEAKARRLLERVYA